MKIRWLPVLCLGACTFLHPTAVPMPVLRYDAPQAATNLVVMLPGRGDRPEAYAENGFVAKVHELNPHADIICPDAHIGYFYNKTIVERLHEDVLASARERYEKIWFVGISMGGMGTAAYGGDHPGVIDGAILLAPYMGNDAIIARVRKDGGPRQWADPWLFNRKKPDKPRNSTERFEQMWVWYKNVLTRPDEMPKLYLGYGEQDRFAAANAMVGDELPPEQVVTRPGGHDWQTWRPLFDELAERAWGPAR